MELQIGNGILRLKDLGCAQQDIPARHIPPSVNLFVKVTNGCNARCLFCSNAGSPAISTPFDVDKLFEMVTMLQEKDVHGIRNHLHLYVIRGHSNEAPRQAANPTDPHPY